MNNATFAGRLGRDAETRITQGGDAVTGFTLAVDERRKGDKSTLWIDCSMWGERGQKVAEYLRKGTPVAVSGQVGVRTYSKDGETRAAITLRVQELTLLGSSGDAPRERTSQQPRGPARAHASTAQAPASYASDIDEDDIPF